MSGKNLQLQAVISAKDQFSKTMKNAQEETDTLSKKFEKFQASAGAFGTIMTGIGTAGVLTLKGFVDAANEAERAQAQLNAVLKSTNGIAGVTAQQANDLAASLQKVTTVGDEAIIAGESMLLTFTNIGKDVFPQATQTLLDMAVAMNNGATPSAEQLSSQAIQLGKALNDPTEGLSALSRVGVKFTAEQEKQIKTMQKNGDIMGAQKIILGELAREFGGSAQAAAQTFSGQVEQMQNRLGELGEELGRAVIPVLTFFTQKLNELVTWFENLTPQQKEFIAQALMIGTAIALAAGAIGLLIAALNPVTLVVAAVIVGFAALAKILFDAGISWQEFGLIVKEAWAKLVYDVNVAVDLVLWQMKRLTLASDKELKEYAAQLDEGLKDEWKAYADAHNELYNLRETKKKEETKMIEDQIAQQRDIVDKSNGKMKEEALEKLEAMKADGLKKYKDLKLGSTAELAAMRKAQEVEIQKANEAMARELAKPVAAAAAWGADLIANLQAGILGKIPLLNDAIAKIKAKLSEIHQSYNPEIPVKLWGQHFLQNFAAGMKESAPKVFEHVDEMKAALKAEFGDDSEIQKLLKDWAKDKNVGENFARIAEQVKAQSDKLREEFNKQKEDYDDLNMKAGEALEQLKTKHQQELDQINQKIEETQQKIEDLNKNYKIDIQGVDTSVGEKVVEQQDMLANLQKQIKDAEAELSKTQQAPQQDEDRTKKAEEELAALKEKYAKESAALEEFLKNSKGLEDEIAEARRRAGETDFERFIEDSESRRTKIEEEFQKRLALLEEEKKSLEDQRQKEKLIFDQKLQQYMQLKEGFTSMQSVFTSGLSAMANAAQDKVTFINKKLAELKAAMAQIQQLSAGTPITGGSNPPKPPKFANGGIAQAQPGGILANLAEAGMNEAVVPLPDGRTIPVQMKGDSGSKQIILNLNFGDVHIAKEVDGDRFISKMKLELTREIQLQQMGSIV